MLALIAGRGRLPEYVAAHAGGEVIIAALEGMPPDHLTPDLTFRIERLGSFLAELRERGVTRVCFAGGIRRPSLDPSAVDEATMPLVPRMMQVMGEGDDAALRAVIGFFEEAGIAVQGAHEIVPDLLPSPGIPTKRQPDEAHIRDAVRGDQVIAALGAADVGQSCAIWNGQVLAVEAMPGTDWMLKSIVAYRPDKSGGIFYKASKPDQDMRIDMPTIGGLTVSRVAKARLDGIVIKAGSVLTIDFPDIVSRLDARDMFLWVRE